jgi:hypothetical protein
VAWLTACGLLGPLAPNASGTGLAVSATFIGVLANGGSVTWPDQVPTGPGVRGPPAAVELGVRRANDRR